MQVDGVIRVRLVQFGRRYNGMGWERKMETIGTAWLTTDGGSVIDDTRVKRQIARD